MFETISRILNEVAGQGPMFWAASSAVALGLTLIIGAAFAQTRKLKRSRAAAALSAQATTNLSGPAASQQSPAPAPLTRSAGNEKTTTALDPDLAMEIRELAARVRKATEILERHQTRSAGPEFGPDESLLKDSATDVEYIYKAGKG